MEINLFLPNGLKILNLTNQSVYKFDFDGRGDFPIRIRLCCSNIMCSSSGSIWFCRISEIVADADLVFLLDNLQEKMAENEKWQTVLEKKNNNLFYSAKCCKPKVNFSLLHNMLFVTLYI